MARKKSILNQQSKEVIEQNILQENPEGIPTTDDKIVMATEIPEMRTIEFINGRDPGYEIMFHYSSKTHPLKHYTLFHGQIYTLPVEIIDHLEGCAERQYAYRKGTSGHPEMYVKGLKYLFQCRTAKKAA